MDVIEQMAANKLLQPRADALAHTCATVFPAAAQSGILAFPDMRKYVRHGRLGMVFYRVCFGLCINMCD